MSREPAAADAGDLGGRGAAEQETDPSLKTVPLRLGYHRTADFSCSQSEQVGAFFVRHLPRFQRYGYCKTLILPDAEDTSRILGFYTLSPDALAPEQMLSKNQQRQVIGSIKIPLMRIGFMGRDDTARKGLGGEPIVDAARRVHRSADTAAWALILEPEDGLGRPKLYNWYLSLGFKPIKGSASVFCPIRSLVPELFEG